MKKFSRLLAASSVIFALAPLSVFADSEISVQTFPDVAPAKPAATLKDRFVVEFAGTMNGAMGSNETDSVRPYTDNPSTANQGIVSDTNLAIDARRFFSENFAIGISFDFASQITDGGRDADYFTGAGVLQEVYLRPILADFRYQWGSLANTNTLRPYVQIGVGPTFATYKNGYGGGAGDSSGYYSESVVAYASARASLGLDIFFTQSLGAYAGIRESYLAVNSPGLSYLQTTALLGYAF